MTSSLFPGLSSPGKCHNGILTFQVFQDPYEPCIQRSGKKQTIVIAADWANAHALLFNKPEGKRVGRKRNKVIFSV